MNKIYLIIIIVSGFIVAAVGFMQTEFLKERARDILFGERVLEKTAQKKPDTAVPEKGISLDKETGKKIVPINSSAVITKTEETREGGRFRYSEPKEQGIPITKMTLNQKPTVGAISVVELHLNYEDVPHKYRLSVTASDPDNDLPLSYKWLVDCGFFPGPATGNPIEWHYNTPGECIDAKATVTVSDSHGAESRLVQPLFP